MIRLLVSIVVLFLAVLGLDVLGTLPVQVAVEWPGGAISPTLRVVVVALVVFAVLAVILWKLLSLLMNGPASVRGYFRGRRRDRGYAALSRGMIAIGSGDVGLAHRYSGEARRLLPGEPLVLLLEAQTAQLEGRSDQARATFNRMLEDRDTRVLGLRGLFIEATRAGELEAARHYAFEAQKTAPGLPWAGTAVIEYQSAEHDWAGALATLDQNAAAKLIERKEAKRLRAVLLTARAMEVEDADPNAARGYALEAHRLAPSFVPAAVVAARVLTRLQDTRKAAKVIEAVWKQNPHPELADAYLHVRPGDSTHDRLKRARTLQALRPHQVEGVLAVARAALDAGEYGLARENLAKALRQQTTQRVCLLMADLEEAETGDPGRVREWLGRAVRADRDETWTADGVVSPTWLPVSPITGRLDAFEWRVPVATESGTTELDGSDLAERAVRPLEPPRPPITHHDDDEDDQGGGTVEDVTPVEVLDERDQDETKPMAAREATAPAPAPSPVPAVRAAVPPLPEARDPMPFRPDDPGPQRDDDARVPFPPAAAFS
jgi:HemY protein